jgi:Ni/Fe-hydrogenase subunit HybB-like protein
MSKAWERNVPVFNIPILTRPFVALCTMGIVACGLVLYREIVGLGPASGMNDAYAWGIWKTFNIMALTGLGSGGFSIGIATWIFGRRRLHTVMRTAVISSFLVYASGLVLLGIDVGRPWNFLWILAPWRWNVHSPMLEVGFCMPLYTAVPLFLEAIPPVLEWVHSRCPELESTAEMAEGLLMRIYPWVLGLAFLLPAMHQSSLGALMLLAGNQVHPLWQTPCLPLLYVWAASFMGFAFVSVVLMICHLLWNRALDVDVLREMSRITAWIIATWLAFRFADLALRGRLPLALEISSPSALFWMETMSLAAAASMLAIASRKQNVRLAFQGSLLAALGGLLYRFDPTTLAFQPRAGAFYFPTSIELLVDLGFLSLAIASFSLLAKVLPILPASNRLWHVMESARWNGAILHPRQADYKQYAAAD